MTCFDEKDDKSCKDLKNIMIYVEIMNFYILKLIFYKILGIFDKFRLYIIEFYSVWILPA